MSEFTKTLRRYIRSGVGVIAVRTRDPMDTLGEVAMHCSADARPVRFWDCARGWIKGDDPVLGESAGDVQSLNLIEAYKQVLAPYNANGQMPENGVYGFIHPHMFVKSKDAHPVLVQMLMLMAYSLPTRMRRVVLTIPTGYSFPPELQELIPIIDHAPPSVDTLADSTDIILSAYRQQSSALVPRLNLEDMKRIGQAGVGMILPEFEASLSRVVGAGIDQQKVIKGEDVRRAMLIEKAEVVRRNKSLEVLSPVTTEQVGGLENLKEWIRERATAMDPAAWEMGVDKPKGVALVGVPGGGKSLCGKMAGSVLGVATIRFDISSVFAGLVGSSEENMREALFLIESLAPCVCLIDEIDKAISVNSGGDGGTSQKVLGTLLTFMQETKAPIFWMMTLNRTENIPAELLRAGRLDQVFGVGVPNARERMDILRYHLKARKADPDAIRNLDDIVRRTDRYVGAEIESIASSARLMAYNDGADVSYEHLSAALDKIRPLSRRMEAQFRAMEQWCKENAVPASLSDEGAVIPALQESEAPIRRRRRNLN